MQGKRIKLIYFSLGDSEVKSISLSWQQIIGVGALSFIFTLTLVFFVLNFFTDIYDNAQIAHLSKSNSQLEQYLAEMGAKIETIEDKVNYIEKEDDDLRVFVDLPQVNSDVKQLGTGGVASDIYLNISALDENLSERASKYQRDIDVLERKIEWASKSQAEIIHKYNEDKKRLRQTPAILPVVGANRTALFGPRMDPFIDRIKYHYGIDYSAPRGTNVRATADGVVKVAKVHYTPNHNYGRYITIDHDYGIETKYAHLHKILVKKGQKVKRYDIIGQVGDTGRSTGPHLHYEVIKDGSRQNPENYIIN